MSKLTRRQTAMPIHFSCVGRPVGVSRDTNLNKITKLQEMQKAY